MSEVSEEQIQEIVDALAENRKIDAIKYYREATGSSLSEAKSFIDDLIPSVIAKDPERFAHLQASGGGCGSAAVLLIAASATIIALLS